MRKTYITKKHNGQSRDEHRLLIEKHINRTLKYNEVVHHIDGNTKNNNISNLIIMTRSEHTSYHKKLNVEYVQLKCDCCSKSIKIRKKLYLYKLNKGQKKWYCSEKCSGKNTQFKTNTNYVKIIKEEYKNGLTGYQISIKYKINKTTVYNHIRKIKNV